jgi:hypothetical protein
LTPGVVAAAVAVAVAAVVAAMPSVDVLKLFYFITDTLAKYARVAVPGMFLRAVLIFVSEVRSYLS